MATQAITPAPAPVAAPPSPAPDINKYYRALEAADAAGDTAGAQEIANEIKIMEGRGGAVQAPKTPTQQRNASALKANAGISPVDIVKNTGKGLASIADIGIEGATGLTKQFVYPFMRAGRGADEAQAKTDAFVKKWTPQTLGKTFGIENDPAYKSEILRRGITKVGETVSPYIEQGVGAVSEATGLPKQDVGNMAANLSLGLPIIGIRGAGGGKTPSQIRADILRNPPPSRADMTPNAAPVVTPEAPGPGMMAPVPVAAGAGARAVPPGSALPESPPVSPAMAPARPSPTGGVPLGPNDIPASPATVSPGVARANALRASQEASAQPPLQSTMSGVGSADVGQMNVRVQAAEQLPIPINLTKGKRTQELAQLQEENRLRYAHGDEPSGRVLLAEDAIANQRFHQNVDYLIDDVIGSANPKDRGAVGDLVNTSFRTQLGNKLTKASDLYKAAENSAEANMLLPANTLENFLGAQNAAIKKSAPILEIADSLLAGRKDITLKELMDLRKVVSSATKTVDTNAHFAGQLKTIIDDIARQAENGAPKFKRAQQYYRLVKQEFEGKGAVKKLSHNKLNTSDPMVAAESVTTTILNGSKKDVENVVRRIKRDKNGQEILKELRGNVIDHIFSRATRGVAKDIEGQSVVSFAGLKAVLKPLEDTGKLKILFEPAELKILHNLTITADSLFNEQALAKNYSGSYYGVAGEAKRLMNRLGTKVPGLNALVEHAEEAARLAKAREAVNPDPKKLEAELKKIKASNDKLRRGG